MGKERNNNLQPSFMIRIEHIALWTKDLEDLRHFYEKYFGAVANNKYTNPKKQLETYFLTFGDGARLELMQRPEIQDSDASGFLLGYAHLAFAIGSKENVDTLTRQLSEDGYQVIDGPRTTGDGYYESVVLDPEGNHIELTV